MLKRLLTSDNVRVNINTELLGNVPFALIFELNIPEPANWDGLNIYSFCITRLPAMFVIYWPSMSLWHGNLHISAHRRIYIFKQKITLQQPYTRLVDDVMFATCLRRSLHICVTKWGEIVCSQLWVLFSCNRNGRRGACYGWERSHACFYYYDRTLYRRRSPDSPFHTCNLDQKNSTSKY